MSTDTDSLLYEIKTEGDYKDLYENQETRKYLVTCDYPENSKYYFKRKYKDKGKNKDETAGKPIK